MRANTRGLAFRSVILLFMILLLFPNSGLTDFRENEESARRENRRIAPFPRCVNPAGKDFYGKVELWYNDRLKFREKIIHVWKRFNFKSGVVLNDNTFVAENGDMLQKRFNFKSGVVLNDGIFVAENGDMLQKSYIIGGIRDFGAKTGVVRDVQKLCRERGVRFLFMTAPRKENVYRELFPYCISRRYKPYEHYIEVLNRRMKSENIAFLDLAGAFLSIKRRGRDDFYFYDDHHWNYSGAAVASDLLLRRMHEDLGGSFRYDGLRLDGTAITAPKDGSIRNMLGLDFDDKCLAPWSRRYASSVRLFCGPGAKGLDMVSDSGLARITLSDWEMTVTNCGAENDVTLLVVGDSYSRYMIPYLSQFVGKIVFSRNLNMFNSGEINLPKLIEKHRPAYLLLERTEQTFFVEPFERFLGDKVRVSEKR